VERIVCGDVILFREQCPDCKEYNLSGKASFSCDCGKRYTEDSVKRTRFLSLRAKRKNLRKYANVLAIIQKNSCYWCYREFGSLILKKTKNKEYVQKTLTIHVDHIIPYSYTKNNNVTNLCASCSICNFWKYNKHFLNENEISRYLIKKWEVAIKKEKIIIL